MKALLFCRLTPLLLMNALLPAALVAEDELERRRTAPEWRNRCSVSGEERMKAFPPRGAQGSFEDEQEGGVLGAGVRGCLGEIHGLLLERIERVFEYDQVRHSANSLPSLICFFARDYTLAS